MRQTVSKFKLGQKVSGTIVEVLAPAECIVNFNGDLIRINNKTGRKLKPQDVVDLVITSIDPLGFRMISDVHGRLDTVI